MLASPSSASDSTRKNPHVDPYAIAHGPEDPPVLIALSTPLVFDIDDIDGGMYMLAPELGGCVTLPFSKPMALDHEGVVTLDGALVPYVLSQVDIGHGAPWFLGVKLIGHLTERGTQHILGVSGFTDTDGNTMDPVELDLVTAAASLPQPEYAHHDAVARRVAEEGIVLLENRGATLPVESGQLNVFGAALHTFRTAVVGAGKINARYIVGLRQAIEAHPQFTLNEDLARFSRDHGDAVPGPELIQQARAASDLGVIVLSRASGENSDNTSAQGGFSLSSDEEQLIATVTDRFTRTVVILNTPYPIDVSFVDRYEVDTVVLAGVGGMLAGPALLAVLDGAVNPSGRLPDTWARTYSDIPSSRNFYDYGEDKPRLTGNSDAWIDTVYEEGLYIGYRYFSTFDVDVAYPFGHGLSYTTFNIASSPVNIPESLPGEGSPPVSVDVAVTNTGSVPGRQVVQAYLTKPGTLFEQAALELVGFVKTPLLEVGHTSRHTLPIPIERLASWDEENSNWVVEPGDYIVRVGASSASTDEAGRFTVDAAFVLTRGAQLMRPVESIRVLSRHDPEGTFPQGAKSGIKPSANGFEPQRPVEPRAVPSPALMNERTTSFVDVAADPRKAADFVAQLSPAELARVVVCGQDGWGMEGTGVAGILAQIDGRDLPGFQVADGNSGVNVRTPNIGMPSTVVLASTFDVELAAAVGRAIGEEAAELGVDLILAPALNLHRNPLNGRHPEYFSEDPVLAGLMAGWYARGLESTGVAACYKHVAGNNAESARKRNQSLIPERALRELYLRAFQIALTTHPAKSVMTAYNAINGRPTAADAELVFGYLRDELGYTGAVMTDWSSYDTVDVVEMMLSGINWVTPGGEDTTFTQPILDAVRSGRLPIELLRENATYLLRTVAEIAASRQERQRQEAGR